MTGGGGAADEEEGNVGGLPGVGEGEWSFCACQSLTAHQDLCNASSLHLQRRQSACLSSLFCAFHFLSLPFFSLFLLFLPLGYNSRRVHGGSRVFHPLEIPPPAPSWRLEATCVRQPSRFTVTGVDPENWLASPIYAVVRFLSHRH